MKTTLEIPDDLFRQVKVTAAQRSQSMKAFVTEAIRRALEEQGVPGQRELQGWRSVSGRLTGEQVRDVDETVDRQFGRIDPDEWK